MRKLKIYSLVGICLLLVISMIGTVFAQDTITFKVGHVMGTDIARHRALVIMKHYIENISNQRIQIKLYPLGQLGETKELLAGIQTGTIDMAILGGELSVVDPRVEVFELPYLFKGIDHLVRAYSSPLAKDIFEEVAEKHNVKFLSPTISGIRYITTSDKPIYNPSDLDGVKIRVPNTKIHPLTLKAMGATVVPLPYSEVYLALQQGVIDGQENPTPQIDSAKFYEVQKYISKTGHIIGCTFLVMSNRLFNSLSEEDQSLMLVGAKLWSDSNNKMYMMEDNMLLDKFESAGATIIEESDIDIEAFRSATKKVIEQFPALIDIAEQLAKM